MRRLTLSLALLLVLLAASLPRAQRGGLLRAQRGSPTALALNGYDLSWWTVDGGGGAAVGGPYTLTGTAGQPDAGVLSGGPYTLGGGFWGGGALAQGYQLFLPLVLRGS
jgi:hypothetical protein